MFIRNFLSAQTPYNGLLLYHGLGTGKTCSAIGVCEETRRYLKQIGITQRIIIVASPNVQENFRVQLFDDRKLKQMNGLWDIRSCTGSSFLSEINPMNMRGLTKEKVITQIRRIINSSYLFLGYIEFANYIKNKMKIENESLSISRKNQIIKSKLNKLFNNRLIVIDEVHNIRMTNENKDKHVAKAIQHLVSKVENMKLLLLSATPMYNSYKEIIWLLNLLNLNDNRPTISEKEVFTSSGDFIIDKDGNEIGKELLIRKATGYISFVKGENPYTFPFRIWPTQFEPSKSLNIDKYPNLQINGEELLDRISILSLYSEFVGSVQEKGYLYIVNKLLEKNKKLEKYNYTLLQRPLEALNIVYPIPEFETDNEITVDPSELVGKVGLKRIMNFKESIVPSFKGNFQYKSSQYGNIFSPEEISKYSSKISSICNKVLNSTGVILIYSQYIDGGLVPIALALESIGFKRGGSNKSLFKIPPTDPLNVLTMKPKTLSEKFKQANYVMITGDKALSLNNANDIKLATDIKNKYGEKVKVVLISQAGSEGLDFKFIRQVHILDPWYNMNRIEQIIGRAVRTCSHRDLPFKERNVEIYLYVSLLNKLQNETVDMYIYRLAESKAIQIGNVSRVLRENCIDCLLNSEQIEYPKSITDKPVQQFLSNKQTIEYKIQNKPYSAVCDYMEKCQYTCGSDKKLQEDDVKDDSYNKYFIQVNIEKIIQRIRDLYKERFFYTKQELINNILVGKTYPIIQINAALDQLVENNNEYISDMYDRLGKLINIDDIYVYQPVELENDNNSLYDNRVPLDYKPQKIKINLDYIDDTDDNQEENTNADFEELEANVNKAIKQVKTTTKTKKKTQKISLKKTIVDSNILQQFEKDIDLIIHQDKKIDKTHWGYNIYKILPVLNDNKWSDELIRKLIIFHMIELLSYTEILSLLNNLEKYIQQDNIYAKYVKEYFINQMLTSKDLNGLFLLNRDKVQLIVSNDLISWREAELTDREDLESTISKYKSDLEYSKQYLGVFIGYMSLFRNNYMIFKIRNMEETRNLGARCDQANKSKTIEQLNILDSKLKIDYTKYTRKELCYLQELILRKFNYQNKNNKIWFANPAKAILINEINNNKK